MSTATTPSSARAVGALRVLPLLHPQGCRTYVLADETSRQALALDVHLDLVDTVEAAVRDAGWTLPYVVDSHTHADHPSGAGALAARFASTRIAHELAGHDGVTRHPADGDTLHLGDQAVTVRHAPGHTPDHLVLLAEGALFAGDTLLIGSVARTDFLGGDAGQLFDSIQVVLEGLPDDTLLYPGHDYEGREHSTLGVERRDNPWLQLDRATFVESITANPPTRPANMDALLELNRRGTAMPERISADGAIARVRAGGSISVIDVRTGGEYASEHIPGSHLIPLDQVAARADEIRAVPAPRLLLCRTGQRAEMARTTLAPLGISGLTVIDGGIEAYVARGGDAVKGKGAISLERQVRIAAGALVALGVGLGTFVHPAFYGLAGFVGLGLVFAGVTNTCAMGMLIARMPWNRAPETAGGSAGGCAASAPSAGGCAASAPAAGGCAASLPPSPTES
ncbi:MAG: DUF2892 domain-containing protein [Planctomycetota bacterium]|nr:DUF2892 domain-containing protein [Planctomycetota bacterium]